jgi:MFS family permease
MPALFSKESTASLGFPGFRNYLFTRFCFVSAMQMQTVITGLLIYEWTRDPLSLGLSGLAEAIPAMSVALLGGHLADRINRKYIILSCLILLFFCSCTIAFLLVNGLGTSHPETATMVLYGLIAMTGIARGFFGPAGFAFISQLVPKKHYGNAATWNSTVWQIAAVGGPAVAGFLYGFAGPIISFATVSVLLLSAIVLLTSVRYRRQITASAEPIRDSLFTGIHFVLNQPVILGALALDMFAVLFGGAVALLPVFAREILNTGPEGLGLLRAAPSFGAVLMALILAKFSPLPKAGRNLHLAIFAFGLCIIGFALSENFYLSLFFLALSGAFDNVSVIIRSTVLQILTPDEMRGRVSAINTMFIGSSNEIGAFESGLAARLLGLVPSVIFGGCMTLFVVTFTALKNKSLLNCKF